MKEPITPRTDRVRLAPVAREEWTDRQEGLLGSIDLGGDDSLNLFTTLAHHPRLLKHWIPFAGTMLLRSTLTPRERELLILRTSVRVDALYEWVAHVSISRPLGFGQAEIDGLLEGPAAALWSEGDAVLLTAVDELIDDSVISERTWGELEKSHTAEQLIEIPMMVGAYVMLGYVVNSLGIEPDAGSLKIEE